MPVRTCDTVMNWISTYPCFDKRAPFPHGMMGKVQPGHDWDKEILHNLEEARIILILVSANMLASRYIHDIEIASALKRHDEKTACVIPVLLQHCEWKETRLGSLQALPKNIKPINQWKDRPSAYLDVVRGIRLALADLKAEPEPENVCDGAETVSLPVVTQLSTHFKNTPTHSLGVGGLGELLTRREGIVVARLSNANHSEALTTLGGCLRDAHDNGAEVIRTDLTTLQRDQLVSSEAFFNSIVRDLGRQGRVSKTLGEMWDENLSGGTNLTYFLRDIVLPKTNGHVVWVVNAVDRLLDTPFHNEAFACFRSIFNMRAFDPTGGWERLTILLVCSSDPSQFIDDPNLSPFNVGKFLELV
ncbi:MAG: hypothetical protein JWQ02_1950 [Capsulimonas sp.]|nr:hypothetical protein [Capsulimonas sp.]